MGVPVTVILMTVVESPVVITLIVRPLIAGPLYLRTRLFVKLTIAEPLLAVMPVIAITITVAVLFYMKRTTAIHRVCGEPFCLTTAVTVHSNKSF